LIFIDGSSLINVIRAFFYLDDVRKNVRLMYRKLCCLGKDSELFTSVLYNLYVAPEGFCFDAFCNDDPIMDNPKFHGYNVNTKVIVENVSNAVPLRGTYSKLLTRSIIYVYFSGKVENFANHVQRYASAFKTNHIMMTMGGDFTYSVASSWFRNMDKLIKYSNRWSSFSRV